MIIINVIDTNKFDFNGLVYPRLFMSIAQGTTGLAIHNVNDVKQQLLGPTHFSEIQVDGVTYGSLVETMAALVPVLYNTTTTVGTGTDVTNINQIPYRSYNDLQDKPILGGDVTVVNNNTNVDTFQIATVAGQPIYETVTELGAPSLTGNILSITLINELMEEQSVSIDLSNITTNSAGLVNATYDSLTNIITIQDRDAQEFYLNLSGLAITGVADENGVVSILQDGVVRATISKVGETGEFNDIIDLPTTIVGYGITDAYTIAQVDALLNDKADITGYNNIQWDQAVAWGDHSQAGYITDETVTKLNQPVLIGNVLTLKYENELGVEQTTQIDLSTLSVDSSTIENGTYDPATKIITLTQADATTIDIDLKQFIVNATTDGGGNVTLTQNSIGLITVSKAGVSGSYSDLLNKPTIPTVPTNVSAFTNDSGYVTGLTWTQVTGKPTEFPPTTHNHDILYYTKAEVDTKLQGTTVEGHTHSVSDITDFPAIPSTTSDLTNDSGYITGLTWAQVTGKPTTFAPSAHTLDSHSNVTISANTNGEILKWNGTAWVNSTLAEAGIASDSQVHSYTDLTNKPFIPVNTSDINNDSGFITGLTWTQVTGKPTTFTPSAHTHVVADITDFPSIPDTTSDLTNDSGFITGVTWGEVTGKPLTFAPSTHGHDYSEITNTPTIPTLVSAFTNDSGYLSSISWTDITAKPTTFTPEAHTHDDRYYTEAEIDTKLADVAVGTHTHVKADITDFPTNVSEFANDAGYLTTADTAELTNQDNIMRVITCEINYINDMNEAGFAQWINDNPITVAQDEVAILDFVYKQKEQYEIVIDNPIEGATYQTNDINPITIQITITDTTTV